MKKISKREAIFNYISENPSAKNKEVAQACGVHYTYVSLVRRNAGVKKPKKVVITKPKRNIESDPIFDKMLNSLVVENEELNDECLRLQGVIKYLEKKLKDATPV